MPSEFLQNEYAIFTILGLLMFVGVIIRKLPYVRKTLLPAPIIGGLIGFVLMNTNVIDLPYQVFERITFHLFTLSFIAITYMGMNSEKSASKKVFKGGLWLALMFGLMISIQAVIGSTVFLGFGLFDEGLFPALGGLVAHGFSQGPGQAVAIGTIWEGLEIENAVQYGLLYASAGYLIAIITGIPYAKRLINKGEVEYQVGENEENQDDLEKGLIETAQTKSIGRQTAHHANLDTLSIHFALILATYFIAYVFAELVTGYLFTSEANEALFFGNMFVWGILFATIGKKVLIKTNMNAISDPKIQSSLAGLFVDFLMLSALMSINLVLVRDGLFAVLVTIVIVAFLNFMIVSYFAKRSGPYGGERFLTEYGITTGTAATGLLLLRVVDPQFKTPVAKELVWWNLLQFVTGILIFTSQVGLPVTNFWLWYIILSVSIAVFLVVLKVTKLWGPKYNG
ncbi:MAG: hypothetical protein ACQEQA_05150 [Bacillota bacterium]